MKVRVLLSSGAEDTPIATLQNVMEGAERPSHASAVTPAGINGSGSAGRKRRRDNAQGPRWRGVSQCVGKYQQEDGLPTATLLELREEVLKSVEQIKWYLWHGNVFRAIEELSFV